MNNLLTHRLMGRGPILLAIVLTLVFVSDGYSQTNPTSDVREVPDFTVQVWGAVVPDFTTRVSNYFELRRTLEEGMPARTVTEDPADFMRAELALARKIRRAREGAAQGAIFTPAISVAFKRILRIEMNAVTWATIMADNPGSFSNRINGAYPKNLPHATMPASILAALPQLPADIQYQFLGRHLVLYDLRANVILDRIPYAIQFTDDE